MNKFEKYWAKQLTTGAVQWNDMIKWHEEREIPYHYRNTGYYYIRDLDLDGGAGDQPEGDFAEFEVYGCWWRFLRANRKDYPPHGEGIADTERRSVHERFGDLGDEFEEWWLDRGEGMFAERQPAPFIRLMEPECFTPGQETPDYVVVKIPLTMRRERILSQLRILLDVFKPGDQMTRHARSTADQSLYPRARYSPEHYDALLAVWKARQDDPGKNWWAIGEELKISPALCVQDGDEPSAIAEKHRDLGTMTRRMYEQATRMMWHALRGRFPCDNEIPSEFSEEG